MTRGLYKSTTLVSVSRSTGKVYLYRLMKVFTRATDSELSMLMANILSPLALY